MLRTVLTVSSFFVASAAFAGTSSPQVESSDLSLYQLAGYWTNQASVGQQSRSTSTLHGRFLTQGGGGSMESGGPVLSGPYFLRSADPEPAGEIELKFNYGFSNSSDNSDEHEVEFVLEWGMAEDLEFIIEVPVVLGEGDVEGNGDIQEFGFHIRHWKEEGSMPAFATRHLIRIPTGNDSDGVDYLLRGLFTKTLSDKARLHFNPFLKSVNGNLDDDTRTFQWGAAIGFDYTVNDDLLVIFDYQHLSSEEEGSRDQHMLEFGADWKIAPHRTIGLQTEFEIDGDSHGTDFGAKVSYIIELEGPRIDR